MVAYVSMKPTAHVCLVAFKTPRAAFQKTQNSKVNEFMATTPTVSITQGFSTALTR